MEVARKFSEGIEGGFNIRIEGGFNIRINKDKLEGFNKDKLETYQGNFQSMRWTFQESVNVLLEEFIKELPTPAYFSASFSATFLAEFMDFS